MKSFFSSSFTFGAFYFCFFNFFSFLFFFGVFALARYSVLLSEKEMRLQEYLILLMVNIFSY